MSLKEELEAATQKAIEDKALTFAINIKDLLVKKAQNGEREHLVLVRVGSEEYNIATSESFIEMVKDLLEGVEVEVVNKPFSMFLTTIKTTYLRLSWGEAQ